MNTQRTTWSQTPRAIVDLDADGGPRITNHQDALLDASRQLLDATLQAIPDAPAIAQLVEERTEGRFRSECEALSRLVGRPWESILAASVSYDVTLAFLCSSAAISTTSGPVLFRNMDWWPEALLAQASCEVEYRRGGETRFEAAGWIATPAVVSGMSRQGFAVTLNAVSHDDGVDFEGYPTLLFLRCVLEDAESYAHAVEMIRQAHLASPGMFLVVGTEAEERIVIERTSRRAAVREPEGNAPLVVTNDYRALTSTEAPKQPSNALVDTACGRFDRLTALAGEWSGEDRSDHELLTALTDDEVQMQITAQHVIARPSLKELRLLVPNRLLG